jgi:hypothetical protein
MNTCSLMLIGNISEISRAALYGDYRDRVTVYVEGAEPLYAELRLPNEQGWTVGQKVMVHHCAGRGKPWKLIWT